VLITIIRCKGYIGKTANNPVANRNQLDPIVIRKSYCGYIFVECNQSGVELEKTVEDSTVISFFSQVKAPGTDKQSIYHI
jgi:hypothetical protein